MANRNLDDQELEDCWVLVFHCLSLKERVRVERVSRKWAALMPYANIHSAHLAHFTWPKDKIIKKQYEEDGDVQLVTEEQLHRVLEAILDRCGQFLHQMDLQVPHQLRLPLNQALAALLVQKAPHLVSLNLDFCVLSLSCVAALSHLAKLEELSMVRVVFAEEDFSTDIEDEEAIKGALSSTLEQLHALKKLKLGITVITPAIRSASLLELEMGVRGFTGAGVQDLVRHCPNLESLSLFNDINEYYMELCALGSLNKLRKLTLRCLVLSSPGLAAICKGCPKLEDLYLDIDPVAFDELWRLAILKSLRIVTGTISPVDDAILASVAKYGLLEAVHLPEANLTDAGLKHLAHTCPNLLKLSVFGIKGISDEGLKAILGKCPKLQLLDVTGTPIGDGAMAAIGALGISLRSVRAWNTIVTEAGVRWLMEERRTRRIGGAQLVQLMVDVSFQCRIARKEMRFVNLVVC